MASKISFGEDSPDPDASQVSQFLQNLEITHRGPDAAVDELRHATTDFAAVLKELAHEYPGTFAIGAIAYGGPVGPLVVTHSDGTAHCSPVALARAQMLARLIARLPEDLLQGFKLAFELELIGIELAAIRASREEG